MKKTILTYCLSLMLILALLAGCGEQAKDGDTANAPNQTVSQETAKAPEDTLTDTKSTDEKVTLTIVDVQGYGLERYDELTKSFESNHPGVTLEVQQAANDYQSVLMSRVNADDMPDVYCTLSATVLQDYSEYAYDWSDDSDTLALFNETALETCKDMDKNIKALPSAYQNWGLLYNKDLFEQAGITELPKTLTELEAACKKLKDAGITAFGIAAKEGWVLNQMSTNFLVDQNKPAKEVVDALVDGSVTLEQVKNYKNLYKFLDLVKEYGTEKPLETDWEASENMLANGDVAIINMGDWCQAALKEFNPNAKIAFLPFPVSEDPTDVVLQSGVPATYSVNKNSKNLELAKEYVIYILTSQEGLDWITNTLGTVPGAKGTFHVAGELTNDAAKYISEGKVFGAIPLFIPNAVEVEVGPLLQGYLLGQTDAAATTQLIQDVWSSAK